MVQPIRSALIGLTLGSAAFLLVALLDGAVTHFAPSIANIHVAQTNLATCLVFVELFAAYLAAGQLSKRWSVGLSWVLIPIAAVYVSAIAKAPYLYACDVARVPLGCAFVHAPFVVGIGACCWQAEAG
jgi:hypothetical protein